MWLGSFHMPLFFFLSGVTVNIEKVKDFKKFFINKSKTLLVPYLMFAVATWIWKFAGGLMAFFHEGKNIDVFYLLKQALGILLQIRTTDYGVGVWFIPCIFVTFIYFWIIAKLSKYKKTTMGILTVFFLVLGYLYCTYINVKTPWSADAALIGVFFMVCGYVCSEYLRVESSETGYLKTMKVSWISTLILIAVSLFCNIVFAYLNFGVLHRAVGMWSNNYGNLIYFLGAAFAGIFFVIVVSNIFCWGPLNYIGQNSIFYYGIHIILVGIIERVFGSILKFDNRGMAFVVTMIIVVVTLIGLGFLCPVYQRLYRVVVLRKRERIQANGEM